jgi:hypothetical protein
VTDAGRGFPLDEERAAGYISTLGERVAVLERARGGPALGVVLGVVRGDGSCQVDVMRPEPLGEVTAYYMGDPPWPRGTASLVWDGNRWLVLGCIGTRRGTADEFVHAMATDALSGSTPVVMGDGAWLLEGSGASYGSGMAGGFPFIGGAVLTSGATNGLVGSLRSAANPQFAVPWFIGTAWVHGRLFPASMSNAGMRAGLLSDNATRWLGLDADDRGVGVSCGSHLASANWHLFLCNGTTELNFDTGVAVDTGAPVDFDALWQPRYVPEGKGGWAMLWLNGVLVATVVDNVAVPAAFTSTTNAMTLAASVATLTNATRTIYLDTLAAYMVQGVTGPAQGLTLSRAPMAITAWALTPNAPSGPPDEEEPPDPVHPDALLAETGEPLTTEADDPILVDTGTGAPPSGNQVSTMADLITEAATPSNGDVVVVANLNIAPPHVTLATGVTACLYVASGTRVIVAAGFSLSIDIAAAPADAFGVVVQDGGILEWNGVTRIRVYDSSSWSTSIGVGARGDGATIVDDPKIIGVEVDHCAQALGSFSGTSADAAWVEACYFHHNGRELTAQGNSVRMTDGGGQVALSGVMGAPGAITVLDGFVATDVVVSGSALDTPAGPVLELGDDTVETIAGSVLVFDSTLRSTDSDVIDIGSTVWDDVSIDADSATEAGAGGAVVALNGGNTTSPITDDSTAVVSEARLYIYRDVDGVQRALCARIDGAARPAGWSLLTTMVNRPGFIVEDLTRSTAGGGGGTPSGPGPVDHTGAAVVSGTGTIVADGDVEGSGSATAPIQTARVGTGVNTTATVTFAAPPAGGNKLIAFGYATANGDWTVPAGWNIDVTRATSLTIIIASYDVPSGNTNAAFTLTFSASTTKWLVVGEYEGLAAGGAIGTPDEDQSVGNVTAQTGAYDSTVSVDRLEFSGLAVSGGTITAPDVDDPALFVTLDTSGRVATAARGASGTAAPSFAWTWTNARSANVAVAAYALA